MTEAAPLLGPARRRTPPAIGRMLRVDHAGEYGAVAIYQGQQAVFRRGLHTRDMADELAAMEAEEQKHLDAFDALLVEHRTRPTLLLPVWKMMGYGLGVATALMGRRAAHLCTEAVETVIEEHYADQAVEAELTHPDLAATFREFREDELHHRDTAIAGGSQEAPLRAPLARAIRAGCHAAIAVSERV